MATNSAADIGANASSYIGSAGLGGGIVEAIKIDTQPLDQLAHYTYLYNKTESDERKAKAIATAKEISDVTAYDLSAAIPKDREVIKSEFDSFNQWLKDNAAKIDLNKIDPISIEYRARKAKFVSLLSGAKTRTVMYTARQKDNGSKDPLIAAELQKKLDKEANSTDIYTQIKPSDDYALLPVETKPAPLIHVSTIRKGTNQIIERDTAIPDYQNAGSQAIAIVGGLIDGFAKEGTPEFNALSPDEQDDLRLRRKLQIYSGKLQPVKQAEVVSSVINKVDPVSGKKVYFDDSGNLDVNALMKGESGNGLFTRVMEQISAYNTNVNLIRGKIANGEFQDNTGATLSFGKGLDESNFQPIDLGKGSISPEEILKMGIIGKTQSLSYKDSVHQTNEGIANAKNATDRAQLAVTAKHYDNMDADAKARLKMEQQKIDDTKEKWKEAMTGGETVKNGAMLHAQRIYDSLVKIAGADRVISPDEIRRLNNEQLKYLGTEKVIDTQTGKTAYQSLTFDPTKQYAIELDNGNVKVMESKGEKMEKTNDGRYMGLWKPELSSNIPNMATNRLNEELKIAGAKELNAYMPLDAGTGEVSSSTSGGGSSASGGSSATTTTSSVPVYSKDYLKSKGYTDEEINQAVKMGNVKLK